jgi:hypothetical protein|tara:strand:- start:1577 stop:2476 length:900 start_codon:yes stop_codon:yes gene_type:complete
MAIQIRGTQIQDGSIAAGKINLAGTFDFSSGTIRCGTPSGSTDVANKAYVDAQLPDSLSGGNGIAIDSSGDPDVISVDLATNPGLQFTSNKLDVKVKAETGGAITKDADGLYIADSAIGNAKLAGSIANAKLANSTISGKALGASLDSLTDGNGIADFTYNGGSAASIAIDLDGSTLSVGASGLKISDLGVDTGQLAANAVELAKIANGAVSVQKLNFQARQDLFTPNGSTAAFALSNEVEENMKNMVMVFRNGLLQQLKASSPADDSEYTVSTSEGTTTVTFGANINSADKLEVRYFA